MVGPARAPSRRASPLVSSTTCLICLLFFFSSRRRHTRSLCDWSSDVCSSDLRTVDLVDDQHDGKPRFVLRKALEARLPVVLVVNKVDRPDARIAEVVDEVYALFLDLDADESQIEFPIAYCNARAGRASLDPDPDELGPDLKPLLELILEHIPPPTYEEGHPLQAL